jgi:hypothetical protein
MKAEKFQPRGSNSVCAGAFPLLRAAAQPRILEGKLTAAPGIAVLSRNINSPVKYSYKFVFS